MSRLRALVVCPGRGSYGRDSLGSLPPGPSDAVDAFERARTRSGRQSVRSLDQAERFSGRLHVAGQHASALTAAVSLGDLEALDPAKIDVVAVCGNSMGWYTALGYAGALPLDDCAELIETMGGFQEDNTIGGQLVYPLVDDQWRPSPSRQAAVDEALARIPDLHWSIRLGGQAVLGGTEAALAAAIEALPPLDAGAHGFPLRLPMHSAFHTPLLAPTAQRAAKALGHLGWAAPRVPLIDGQGRVWRPHWADPRALAAYTLGPQIDDTFDFGRMLATALGDYAPDVVILPGPGSNLGGAIAQVMVGLGWAGIHNKDDFVDRQASAPILLALRWPDQRARAT